MPLTIPPNTLSIVMENLFNSSMGEYIRLAQVNREFRRVFLSNAAWAKFDVHGARGEVHVYRYGGYELRGIAARFYSHLISRCDRTVRAWFLLSKLDDDDRRLAATLMPEDRYAQLHVLTLIDDYGFVGYWNAAFFYCLPLIELDVWRLWGTHVREARDEPITGFEYALPAPVAGDKRIVLALLQQSLIPSGSRIVRAFEDDRDINLVVAAHYLSRKVGRRLPSRQLLQDAEFVLEALHFADSDCTTEGLRSIVSHQWHHKAIVLRLVSINGGFLVHASEELRADREIVLAAVKTSAWTLHNARGTLTSDRGFLLKALKVQLPVAQAHRTERDIVLQAVKVYGRNLKWAPDEFQGDREIVLAAVQIDGKALMYAAESLRGDRGVVLAALKNDGDALRYASAELKNDRQVVLDAIKKSDHALDYASAELKNDCQVVLEAVKRDADALDYASAELKNDRQVVLEAVKCDGYALQYASEALRADGIMVLAAIRQKPSAFKYASAALRGNCKFIFSGLKFLRALHGRQWAGQSGSFWRFVSDEVPRDQSFVLKMIVQGVLSLRSVRTISRHDRQLVLCAVKNDASELSYAPDKLRDDHDFMLCVFKQNGDALRWVGPGLQADKNLVLAAVWQSPSALRYASQELRDDPDILAAAQGKRARWSSCIIS